MSSVDRYCQDVIDAHPYPSADPVDRLRHTVSVFADLPAGDIAVMATGGIYPDDVCIGRGQTGITHGDLRALLAILDGE